MALNFPASPVPDQKFITPNNLMYIYDGTKWNFVRSEARFLPDPKVNMGKYLTSDGTDYIWAALFK